MITRNSISSSVCWRLIEKSQILAKERPEGTGSKLPVARNLSVGTNSLHERPTTGRVSCRLSMKSDQRQNCLFAVKSTAEFRAGFEIVLTYFVSY